MADSFFLASADQSVKDTIEERRIFPIENWARSRTNRRAWVEIFVTKVAETATEGKTKGKQIELYPPFMIWNKWGASLINTFANETGQGTIVGTDPAMAGRFSPQEMINATQLDWSSRHGPGRSRGPISLTNFNVTLEGSAGSLRRCTGTFICPRMEQFNELHDMMLRPSTEIEVQYAHTVERAEGDKSKKMKFVVYDFAFTMTQWNTIECSFKAVGKGQEVLEANVFNTAYLNADCEKEFIADYNVTNEKKEVSSLFDLLDWLVQETTGKLNSMAFNVKFNSGWMCKRRPDEFRGHSRTGIDFCIMKAPSSYGPPGKQKVGVLSYDRITYFSLNFLIWVLNKYVISPDDAAIICDDNVTKGHGGLKYQTAIEDGIQFPIYSADPICVMLVRKGKVNTKNTPSSEVSEASYYNNYSWTIVRANDENLRFDMLDKNESAAIDNHGDYCDLSRILVSRDLLRAMSDNYLKIDSEGEETSKVPIKKFLKDIFATIKDLTGGAVNLFLVSPDDPDKAAKEIHVRNLNEAPGDEAPEAVIFNPLIGQKNYNETCKMLKVTGKVPKGTQAAAFGGTPGSDNEESEASSYLKDDPGEDSEAAKTLAQRLNEAFLNLAYSEFDSEAVSGAKGVLKELVNQEPLKEKAKKRTIPYPLEMEVTLEGLYGFKFGDTVTSEFLPSLYKKIEGLRVAFTVAGITDKISGGVWVTELKTVCRLVNN